MESGKVKASELLHRRNTVEEFYSPAVRRIKLLTSRCHYPLKSVAQFAHVRGGKRLPPATPYIENHDGSAIPYVRTCDIRPESGAIDLSNVVYIDEATHNIIRSYQLQQNDIVISIAGTIGAVGMLREPLERCNFNENMAKVRVFDSELLPEYVCAYFGSSFGQALIHWLAGGAVQAKLSLERIGQIPIPIPPLEVQNLIIQTMRNAYEERRRLLLNTQAKIQQAGEVFLHQLGLIRRDFSDRKRLVVTKTELDRSERDDVGFRDPKFQAVVSSLLQQFKGEIVTLGKIASITSGSTPLGSVYVDNGVDFLRVQNIKDTGIIDLSNPLQVTEDFARTIQRAELAKGDVLLSIAGTIGKVGVITELSNKTVVNQAIARIRLRGPDVLPQYLEAALRSPLCQTQIAMLKRPVLQGNLNHRETASIQIPLVDLREQQTICDEVNHLREEALMSESEASEVVRRAQDEVHSMILGEDHTVDDRLISINQKISGDSEL